MSKKSSTVSTANVQKQSKSDIELAMAAKNQFIAVTMTMSWQLAIVVLVPILGGFQLDKQFNTEPYLFILGFILAVAGLCLVVWRQMKMLKPVIDTKKGAK